MGFLSPRFLGFVALPLWPARLSIEIPPALHWRVANDQLFRLFGVERHRVVLPPYYNALFSYSQPVLFGELAIMLWLLIKGAKDEPSPLPVAATA